MVYTEFPAKCFVFCDGEWFRVVTLFDWLRSVPGQVRAQREARNKPIVRLYILTFAATCSYEVESDGTASV